MIYRDRLVLTNRAWGIRNVEILFDILFLCVLLVLSIGITVLYISLLAVPFFLFLVFGIFLFFLCKRLFGYSYPISIFADVFLGFLFMPVSWMNGFLLSVTLVLAIGIFFFLLYRFHIRLPISVLVVALQSAVFAIFNIRFLDEISPFLSNEIVYSSWIPNYSQISPLFGEGTESLWISLSWLGFFPYFLGVFRRYSVMFVGFLMFLWVVWGIHEPSWERRIFFALNYSGFFFAAYLLPGRSHYSGIYASLISLGIVGILTFFMEGFKIGNLIAIFFVYFLVEAIILELFYGKHSEKRQL